MHLANVPILLCLLVAGCATIAPDVPVAPKSEGVVPQPTTPQPEVVAPTPTAPPPTARASAPAATPSVPAGTPAPAAPPSAATEAKSAAHGTGAPAGAAARPPAAPAPSVTPAGPAPPAAPPALDLKALKEQLKETKAIGVMTKLTLKNQVDDLLQQFRDFYQGKAKVTMAQLRRSYDLLLMKVLSLLQDADQKLASAIVASREAIWGLLADPKKFATLEG